jgi:hypothetical protein
MFYSNEESAVGAGWHTNYELLSCDSIESSVQRLWHFTLFPSLTGKTVTLLSIGFV